MAYHIDAEHIRLDDLRARIESTDLVPSRAGLTVDIRAKMEALQERGIETLASLRDELKTPKRLAAVADATGIDPHYLTLLRREIEGYFPKPAHLSVFDWLSYDDIVRFDQHGIGDTATLREMASSAERRSELATSTGVNAATLEVLAQLADLMRVQWVSPTLGRMLIAAGYDGAAKVAAADADVLCGALARINAGDGYFKGRIGLRDIKRLVKAASHV